MERTKITGTKRENVKRGVEVDIVLKEDQSTGKLTHGEVADILTSSNEHHRGIKVRLKNGQVGRVRAVYPYKVLPNGTEYQEEV